MKISIFGTGYVGLVTGACLANLGHIVTCVDIDQNKINQIKQGSIPFFEPNLPELVKKNIEKQRLLFTTDAKAAVESATAIFNCVGTPGKEDGTANLTYIFTVTKTVAEHILENKHITLINKSTVPPGTAKQCQDLISQTNPNANITVISNPEFLKEGAAVYDFTHPDRIVIGTQKLDSNNLDSFEQKQSNINQAIQTVKKIYLGRTRLYIPFIETNWETSEMIKYASNAFLATKISFINEIANISDKVNADIKVIAQAMGMDYRISPKFLGAGIGYGGSCFGKDVRALETIATQNNISSKLLYQVDNTNKKQKTIIVDKIKNYFKEKLDQTLEGKTITILGLSFKPKTSDMREAPSIDIIKELIKLEANIQAYDPIATNEARKCFTENELNKISFKTNILEACQSSDAIVIVTEWDEFRTLNLQLIKQLTKNNIIFDGRNIYEPELIQEEGFDYIGIGRS